MELRQLKYFLSVAKNLNFTRSAAELFITQPTLSQQIAELEKEIGVQLFVRSTRKIKLTHAGTTLLGEAKILMNQFESAIALTQQADHTMAGRLRIGILGPSERRFLPAILTNFREKYPRIQLELKQFHLGTLDIAFSRDEIDIGFTLKMPNINSDLLSHLSYQNVYTDHLCLITPHIKNINSFKLQDCTQLANNSLVFMNRELGGRGLDDMLRILTNRGIHPSVLPTQNLDTTLLSIESGLGVSVFPRHVPEAYSSPNISVIDIDGEYVDIVMAWKKASENPLITAFVNELEQHLNSDTPEYASPYTMPS